ncbi:MAG: NAD(P)/FAD-dependent oxidoreductase [Xenococcaceae cyanobacterium]
MSTHAVVIGGGIGGLLAAHALAGRFGWVTIIERHHYPPDGVSPVPQARLGVPQSCCLHLLMAAGAAAFDELTPGWREASVALGAVPFDASADAAMRFPSGWLTRTASGITMLACSRSLLENVLRRGFGWESKVQVLEGQEVRRLLSDRLGERVTGVCIAERHGADEVELFADLVVDASGAGSTLPRWLACLPNGVGSPVEETLVETGRRYVSCWFHLNPANAPDWHLLSMAPTAETGLRSAMMLRAEEDCWGVVLQAPVGEPLPSDDREFLDFTVGLGDGKLRDVLDRARPVSPINYYGSMSNRMRHYERIEAWPVGLVALGDSVCTLDPYFGLGMTAAARGAVLLKTYLDQESGGLFGLGFQKELSSLNIQPWQLATGRDPDGQLIARDDSYLTRLYKAAPSNPEVAHALIAVHQLLRPAETLMEVVVT